MDAGWDLHRSFLGVLRFGSLSAAARALGLTQPTLGRHIDALEQALGVKLFARSRHGLLPSGAALALRPHAEAMEAAAAAMARAASGESDEPGGAVRLTASNLIGAEVLPAILTAFREAHPKIAIELVLSNRNQDLSRRDADIAVRMVRPSQKTLVAKRLGSLRIGLYAHRRYLARHGMPRNFEELAGHTLIGFDRDAGAFRALAPEGAPDGMRAGGASGGKRTTVRTSASSGPGGKRVGKTGAGGGPGMLGEKRMIGGMGGAAGASDWLGGKRMGEGAGRVDVTREIFALRTDDDLAQLNALRAGFGIGGTQAGIAARDGGLVPVLPGVVGFGLEMWLAMHRDLQGSRRVRLLFDHLAAALGAYAKAS